MLKGAEQPMSQQNSDGTYSLESSYVVNTSLQESERVLTCTVQHEAQPPIRANLLLSTAAHATYKATESPGKLTSGPVSSWVPVFCVDPSMHWRGAGVGKLYSLAQLSL